MFEKAWSSHVTAAAASERWWQSLPVIAIGPAISTVHFKWASIYSRLNMWVVGIGHLDPFFLIENKNITINCSAYPLYRNVEIKLPEKWLGKMSYSASRPQRRLYKSGRRSMVVKWSRFPCTKVVFAARFLIPGSLTLDSPSPDSMPLDYPHQTLHPQTHHPRLSSQTLQQWAYSPCTNVVILSRHICGRIFQAKKKKTVIISQAQNWSFFSGTKG